MADSVILQVCCGKLSFKRGQKILRCNSMAGFIEKNRNEFIWPTNQEIIIGESASRMGRLQGSESLMTSRII